MPCVHEFGIIENFDRRKDYGFYAPKEYNCISVDDDLINDLSMSLNIMKPDFAGTDAQKVKQEIQKDVSEGQGAMTSREAGAMHD